MTPSPTPKELVQWLRTNASYAAIWLSDGERAANLRAAAAMIEENSRALVELEKDREDAERYRFICSQEVGASCNGDGKWAIYVRGGWTDEYPSLDSLLDRHRLTATGPAEPNAKPSQHTNGSACGITVEDQPAASPRKEGEKDL